MPSDPTVPKGTDEVALLKAKVSLQLTALNRKETENAQLRAVLAAARCIRHWHDRMIGQDEGMVVSAEHVRLLWAAIADHDKAMGVTDAG